MKISIIGFAICLIAMSANAESKQPNITGDDIKNACTNVTTRDLSEIVLLIAQLEADRREIASLMAQIPKEKATAP